MYSAAELTIPTSRPIAVAPSVPAPARPADGLQLLGRYEGSGFKDEHFLVARADGQVVHLSALLYHVLAELAPGRGIDQVAHAVSAQVGKILTPDGVRFLLERKLAPGGLVDLAPDRPVPAAGSGEQTDAVALQHSSAVPGASGSTAALGPRPAAPAKAPAKAQPRKADPLLALRLHRVLLGERATALVAQGLRFMFAPMVIALLLAALLVVDARLVTGGAADVNLLAVVSQPLSMLAVLGMLLGGTLFHEFGHAAGCRYGGGRPGAIGVGVYVIMPAFYTNVTDAYRLDRAGRLRTDLGGIYFNAVAALAFGAGYLATGWVPFLFAAFMMHLEALQQCLPLIRSDGYFILADLVGVPDLFGRIRPVLASLLPWRTAGPRVRELRPRVRVVISAWVLAVVPILAVAMVYLMVQTPTIVRSAVTSVLAQCDLLVAAVGSGSWAEAILAVAAILLLVVPLAGLSVFLVRLAVQVATLAVTLPRNWHTRRMTYGRHHAPRTVPAQR